MKNREGVHPVPHMESVFMDSGAFTLFNDYTLKRREKRTGKHGKQLEAPIVRRGQGDYSWFDLSKGSEFRTYCDRYASFMKAMAGRGILFANVDVIQNPDLTWESQRFFEEEHGVQPIPIVHGLTPMKYLHRYLDTGRYDLIGLGGLGHHIPFSAYIDWADDVFLIICPESKGYMPQVRVHGFAMTSFHLMRRWPWWSVDSASWVKTSAYGGIYVPRWSKDGGWRFDRPPIRIGVSSESSMRSKEDQHIDNVGESTRELVFKWVKHCGMREGTLNKDGTMKEFGIRSHFRARHIVNLTYMKDFEASLPRWPHKLDPRIVELHRVNYHRGFGL